MVTVAIVLTILIIIGYMIAMMARVSLTTYFSSIAGFLGILTIMIFFANYRRAREQETIAQSKDRYLDILKMFNKNSLVYLWNKMNKGEDDTTELTGHQEFSIHRALKIVEIVNMEKDLDKVASDDNRVWIVSVERWLKNNKVKEVWEKFKFTFEDRTNKFFEWIMAHL